MSGIFKSVKKVFKKIGKVVKKIAPYLLIAAGIYFGGAYLMSSMGGAGAAASSTVGMGQAFQGASVMERVAGAFKVSGGVWKSFLGGMGTTAGGLKSAAAFANGTYNAMVGGAKLSAGLLQGTQAVVAVSQGMPLAQAVTAGEQTVSSVIQLTDQNVAPIDAATKVMSAPNQASGVGQFGPPGRNYGVSPTSLGTATSAVPTTQRNYTDHVAYSNMDAARAATFDDRSLTQDAATNANLAAQKTTTARTQPGVQTESIGAITDAGKAGGIIRSPVQGTTTTLAPPGPNATFADRMWWHSEQIRARGVAADEALLETTRMQNDRIFAAMKWNMGMQGVGLLMSAFRPDTQEEKEYKHAKNWKPSDDLIDLDSLAQST